MISNDRKRIGSYIGRPIFLSEYSVFIGDDSEAGATLYLLLCNTACAVDQRKLRDFLDSAPLGIMIGGERMTAIFNDIIELLSSRPPNQQVMTLLAGEIDVKSAVQEFFQGFWPAEDRFDAWTGYHIFNFGYDADLIENCVRYI